MISSNYTSPRNIYPAIDTSRFSARVKTIDYQKVTFAFLGVAMTVASAAMFVLAHLKYIPLKLELIGVIGSTGILLNMITACYMLGAAIEQSKLQKEMPGLLKKSINSDQVDLPRRRLDFSETPFKPCGCET